MSYYYLATPYSKYPEGRPAAFDMACRQAAILLKAKISVYCPIAHGHAIGDANGIDPLDWDFWMEADAPMMEAAKGLIVVAAPNWQHSRGIGQELRYFAGALKPIVWMEVDILPEEFR